MPTGHYIGGEYQSEGIRVGHSLSHPSLTGAWQSPYQQSITQNFPIGTRLQIEDRVFYYCQAADTLATAMKAGHCSDVEVDVNTEAAITAAGSLTLVILDTATRAAHYYQNGYIWIMNTSTGVYQFLKIKDSDAAAAADDQVTLHLYDPLPFAVPASTFTTTHRNPYAAVSMTTTSFMSMVCVPLIPVTTSYYFWGQTWGPCYGTAMSAIPGAASGDRSVYFNGDGALINGASLTTNGAQYAGYVLSNTTSGGDQWYQLMLAP